MNAKNLILFLLLLTLSWLCESVGAQIALPNGTISDSTVDMRVKVIGGYVTVERQFMDGKWLVNPRWKPAELGGQPSGENFCQAYPEIKIQDRTYSGDGQNWTLENRYSVRTTDYFTGTGCAANRIKTLRWQDRTTSQWMEYQRNDASTLQFQLVKYGDRNNASVNLVYDDQNRLQEVRDHFGNLVFKYIYVDGLLAEIQDNPDLIPGNTAPMRRVKYEYATTSRADKTYPVIVKVTDLLGNITRYSVTGGNLTSVTDAEGRTRQYQYTADRVTKVIAPDGAETSYSYSYDKLKKQFYVLVTEPSASSSGGNRITENWYDDQGFLLRQAVGGIDLYQKTLDDTTGRRQTYTIAPGRKTEIVKDEFGNIVKTTNPDGTTTSAIYSSNHGQVLEETDEAGNKTQYEYDSKGNRTKRIEAAGTLDQRVTEYEVNSLGQTVKFTRKGRTEANGTVTPDAILQIEYGSQGQITQTTDPEGSVRQYAYDIGGNLLSYTDPLGHVTRYQVDANGNLIKQTDALGRVKAFAYDKVGNLTAYTDARGKATQAAYDAMNRRNKVTNPIGGVYTLKYNAQGLPIAETDEDGRTSQTQFDNYLRPTQQSDALGNKTEYGYSLPEGSATGTLPAFYEPSEIKYPTFTQRTHYDGRNRPTVQTLFNPNAQGTEGLVSSAEYDVRGQIKSETDANDKTRFSRYDALGQLVETTDSLGHKTQALYDARGNLLQNTDANGHVNRFEYDRNNRVVKEILPLGQTTTYQYDAAGNLVERIDPNKHKLAYRYNAANRIIEVKHYQSDASLARTTTLTWDDADNLIAWSDTDHTRNQTSSASADFDAANHKIGETVTYPDGFTLSYTYDYSLAGKKTRLTWPDGTPIDYAYSGHGQLASVTIPGEGRITVNQFKWTSPEITTLPGGSTQNKTFDGLLKLDGFKAKTPDQQTVLEMSHKYGKVQELKARSRTDTLGGISSTRVNNYTYDTETRLTQAVTDTDTASETESFTLDAAGNRIAHSKTTGAWTYDANNRLIQRGTSVNVTFYQYDEAGNLTQQSEPGKTIRYAYDTQNRLVEVRDGGNNLIARYGYDPLDQRIWKEQYRDQYANALARAKRTYYLYADEGLIAESVQDITLNADGTVTAETTPQISTKYGPTPDAEFTTGILFVKTKDSNGLETVAYYHHDHLQTPVQATDKQGNLVWSAAYEPFGKAIITTPEATADNPTIPSKLRLPGQIEDPETGLHYNFRRYYEPQTGRYITQDPISLDGGYNQYRYADADPVNISDPTGEFVNIGIGALTGLVSGYAIAKLTGDKCYGWKDALTDAALGATGAGLISYLNKLNRIAKLRRIAKSRGLQNVGQKGYVETWKNGSNALEKLDLKFEAGKSANLLPGSKVPRFSYRIDAGKYWDPFTGQVGPKGALSHVPLEPITPFGAGAAGAVGGAATSCGCGK